jgi:HTH-type transcriptional regulator/antitoxin HigA
LNIGPGAFIKEELEVRNWTQEDLAEILGLSLNSVSKLMMNKRAITIDTAGLLSKAFGQSPQYWINLDTNFRLRSKNDSAEERSVETKSTIYKYLPLNEMKKKGWLKPCKNVDELVGQIMDFWNISALDFSFLDKASLPNLRKSAAWTQYNKYYALTWFRMAQRCAKMYKASEYSKTNLRELCNNFHSYTATQDNLGFFLEDLNKAGVKFFVLSHLQKTYIDGSSFYDNGNPVIAYTRRYDRLDNFWFTVAHEIAHILLHLRKRDDFFIDDLGELTTQVEKEANDFANDMVRANEILKYFKPYRNYISQARVESCSEDLQVSRAIVVGVLQHNGLLSRKNLNRLKQGASQFIPQRYWVERYLNKVLK